MSKRNLLLLLGLGLLGYWFYTRKPKRKQKVVDINPEFDTKSSEKMEAEKVPTEPKTMRVDLSKTKGRGAIFPSDMRKDYNTSKEATIAPPLIRFE